MFPVPRRATSIFVRAFALAWALVLCATAHADVPVTCRLVFETAEGVYVDVGSEIGLKKGIGGWLYHEGKEIARIDVESATEGSTFLKVYSERVVGFPRVGAEVELYLSNFTPSSPAEEGDGESGAASPTLKDRTRDDDVFVPLLASPDMRNGVNSDAQNIFHGRLTLQQAFQVANDDDLEYFRTSVGSSGRVERIDGTPWTFEWSADATYRGGDAYSNVRDHEEIRLEVYQFSLFRRFDDRSMVRFGRFIPRELPSVGYLDGVQGEKVLNENWRIGGMVGFRADRDDLNLSVREPTFVSYATYEAGSRFEKYYSGTAGLLLSMFHSDLDRFAIILDQTLQLGKLSLFSSSEVDIDVGGAESRDRDDVRISRLDAFASYRVAPVLTLRGGLDRYERPDTEAERDLIDPVNILIDEFFDRGYWRYWVGASHELFWNLRLSEEASLIDSEVDNYTLRYNVSLTRVGLPFLPTGSISVIGYNLRGDEQEGYGGRITALLPFLNHQLTFQPSGAFRYVETDNFDDDFSFTDVSLRANWVLSRSWSVFGGVRYAFDEEVDGYYGDVGVSFRW